MNKCNCYSRYCYHSSSKEEQEQLNKRFTFDEEKKRFILKTERKEIIQTKRIDMREYNIMMLDRMIKEMNEKDNK